MYAIKTIIYYTALSLLRQKITSFFLITTIFLIGIGTLMSTVDIGIRFRLFENILLASQTLLIHLFAWIYTFEQWRKEFSQNLFVLPLSTDISRFQYLVGRYLGIVSVVIILSSSLLLIDLVLLRVIEQQWLFFPLIQIFFICLSAILSISCFYFFVNITSPIQAMLYCIALWFIGHGLDEFVLFSQADKNSLLNIFSQVLYYFLPNFSVYDLTSAIINRTNITLYQLVSPIIYTFGYSFILIYLSCLIFSKKNL